MHRGFQFRNFLARFFLFQRKTLLRVATSTRSSEGERCSCVCVCAVSPVYLCLWIELARGGRMVGGDGEVESGCWVVEAL